MPSVITNTTSNPTINAAKLRIRKPIQVDLQSACAEADLLGQDLFVRIISLIMRRF